MLSPSQQALFRRLAVFRGGFSMEGAEVVCRMERGEAILAGLESLVEKNLLSQGPSEGEPWCLMLETIRAFANERLEKGGEAEGIRLRHARHYLEMAELAEPELDRSAGVGWIKRLEQEYGNFRAALAWSTEHTVEIALRISGALERFFTNQGHSRDEREWLEGALARSESAPGGELDRWRAKAFAALSVATMSPWRAASSSIAASEESLALWRKVQDKRGLGHALLHAALARSSTASAPGVILALLEESTSLLRSIDDPMGLAHALYWLAYFTCVQGDLEKAKRIAEEDREVARRAGDLCRFGAAPGLLGLIAAEEGDFARAQSLAEESLALLRAAKDNHGISYQLCSLGAIALLRGNHVQAHSHHDEVYSEGYTASAYPPVVRKTCTGFVSLYKGFLDHALASFREAMVLLQALDSPWAQQCLCACLAGAAGIGALTGRAEQAAHILGGVEAFIRAPYPRLPWGHDLSITSTLIRIQGD